MTKVTSKYKGHITFPDGKKIKFEVEGESEASVRRLIRDSQPSGKVSISKKK